MEEELTTTFQQLRASRTELATVQHSVAELRWLLEGTRQELEAHRRAYAAQHEALSTVWQRLRASQEDLAASQLSGEEVRRQWLQTQDELTTSQEQLALVRRELVRKETVLHTTRAELAQARKTLRTRAAEIERLHRRLAPLKGVGSLSLRVARSLTRYARAFPLVSRLAKRLLLGASKLSHGR